MGSSRGAGIDRYPRSGGRRRGLEADAQRTARKPFRAKTFTMGQPLVPSLDKSLTIAAALEDEEIARKLALCK